MKCRNKFLIFLMITIFTVISVQSYSALQTKPDTIYTGGFIKTEINSGFLFFRNNSREAFNSDLGAYLENKTNYCANYFYLINRWNLTDEKYEELNFLFGIGPVYSTGTSNRTSSNVITEFDDKIYGINLLGELKYSGRFYYEDKSYALVEVDGYGRFERIKKHSEGIQAIITSSGFATDVEEEYLDNRLRYGIKAKAGWGIGKPEVVNYLMAADFLLDKYYKGQLYSVQEKQRLASVIGRLKNGRSAKISRNAEKEAGQIGQFLNSKMLLPIPETLKDAWIYGEFSPRYDGSRFEAGPFFTYYNREPDYIFGGFIKYETNKYQNFHWNRYFKTELSYNRYKTRDWFRWEANLSFDYYKNLRSEYSFGIKYIPVLVVNDFQDFEPVQHVIIPYLECYTQLNEKLRMNLAFRYTITDNNDFFMKGPEFSLALYSSRY